jgi:hypothetical protein
MRRQKGQKSKAKGQKSKVIWYAAHSLGVFIFVCVLPIGAAEQVVCALGPGASSYKPGANQRPTPDAAELAERVNTALKTICSPNCPSTAFFRNTTAANLMLVAESGQAKLIYAPQFFATAYDQYGDGAIIGIIAHEMGHALDDTMGAAWVKSTWTPELRADSWAGCTLARIDLSPGDLEAGLAALAKYPAPGHPAWSARLPVLRIGYTQCGGDGARFDHDAAGVK